MKQITIITQANRPGTLADIAERLAARNVNILDIDATDDHAHAVVVLRAEPYNEALRALADGGYHAVGEEVLVIRIPDEAGALAKLAARFREPQININAMRIVRRDGGWASVLISTDDNARAKEILADCLV
ncbi:MAG: ACT domain-containing protein [Chthonomonadales bacterium]|nr:ACT domain-containing protein [Chthonomonadales bacterium]